MSIQDRLFVGVYPCGIVYADRAREEGGEYKRIAFLDYKTLYLRISCMCREPDLVSAIADHASTIISRRGERFETSACGQSVVLGA